MRQILITFHTDTPPEGPTTLRIEAAGPSEDATDGICEALGPSERLERSIDGGYRPSEGPTTQMIEAAGPSGAGCVGVAAITPPEPLPSGCPEPVELPGFVSTETALVRSAARR